MNCCLECFDDKDLTGFIRENGQPGSCGFCGSTQTVVIETTDLLPLFQPIIDLYRGELTPFDIAFGRTISEIGEPLGRAIAEEWGIFSWKSWDLAESIMRDMCRMTDHDPPRDAAEEDLVVAFDASWSYRSPSLYWETFAEHIRFERRFVLRNGEPHRKDALLKVPIRDPREWLPEALGLVEKQVSAGASFWRARRWEDPLHKPVANQLPEYEWLGAPTPDRTRPGRANSAGIPVFYGALDPKTCSVEVRPATGQFVWVAEWKLRERAKLADLCNVPRTERPFAVPNLRDDIERRRFLRAVSVALALPVAPHEEEVGYVPTQYVVEVIRDAGYGGLLYESSQNPGGTNAVIFDPAVLQCVGNCLLTQVKGVDFQFSPPFESRLGQESGAVNPVNSASGPSAD